MRSPFRKISSVRSLTGGTTWYLSEDCLLAAKRVMYSVEYRRFYLRDLESIVVWPNPWWLLRPIVPALLLVLAGVLFWRVNFTFGSIVCGVGLAWAAVELALGPTVKSRICTTGATVDLPLVGRARRARRVLAKIDEAILAARGGAIEQAAAPVAAPQPPEASLQESAIPANSVQASSEQPSTTSPVADLT